MTADKERRLRETQVIHRVVEGGIVTDEMGQVQGGMTWTDDFFKIETESLLSTKLNSVNFMLDDS